MACKCGTKETQCWRCREQKFCEKCDRCNGWCARAYKAEGFFHFPDDYNFPPDYPRTRGTSGRWFHGV